MSALAPCPACQHGDHTRHVEHWMKAPEGVLGGAHCGCPGDCKVPDLSAIFGASDCETCDGNGYVTHDIDRHGRRYINQPVEEREHPCDDCDGTGEQP